jgi:regulator of sigma E protease
MRKEIPEELRDRAFQFRPVWQRFLIVLAGPVANFILAIAIFTAFFRIFRVAAVECGSKRKGR